MPRVKYITRKFSASSRAIIDHANVIIAEYLEAGYKLTLRQLYYQFVARDLIANKVREYKRLGSIVNDGRMAGLIDWDAIEDRTRNLHKLGTWADPAELIAEDAEVFKVDLWEDQPFRVEVWIEKEALAGVFERVCDELRVPFFSCRGYTSQSEMWSAAQRLRRIATGGQTPVILHFGDHDPSGIDMTRDIRERLELFARREIQLERLALNMDQVEEHQPPPNPAKDTDSRFAGYLAEYGDESWELDALEPDLLAGLVRNAVTRFRNAKKWKARVAQEQEHQRLLGEVANRWDEVEALLADK